MMSSSPFHDRAKAALDEAHAACFGHQDRDVLGMSHGPFSGVNVALGIVASLEDRVNDLELALKPYAEPSGHGLDGKQPNDAWLVLFGKSP